MARSVSFRELDLSQQDWTFNFLKTVKEVLDNNKTSENYYQSSNRNTTKNISSNKLSAIDAIGQFEKNIACLENKIYKEFNGPCFDETYRILTEECCQYQQELDTIDVAGQPEIRLRRKECLIRVDNAATELNNKAHTGGKPCSKCVVRK